MRAHSFIVGFLVFAALGWGQSASPVIRYANIMGGSASEAPAAVTTDSAGNIYIAGQTASADFPSTKRFSPSSTTVPGDVFVTKVDPAGRNVLYSVIVGAGQPAAIAVDGTGNAYVAGVNPASTFPTTAGNISVGGSCFLFKLNSSGSDLVYSTRLPCNGGTGPAALAVDATGAAYLAGNALSVTTTPGAYKTSGSGPFAMKVNAQGAALVYSTYLPCNDTQPSVQPRALALDAQGNAYITGSAHARELTPTVQPLPSEPAEADSRADVFVLELSADGAKVPFSTLFGGSGDDYGSGIAVDAEGFIYVGGTAHSTAGPNAQLAFPTTGGALDRDPGFLRGFLTKLAPLANSVVFSTFLPQVFEAPCLSVSQAGIDVAGRLANGNRLLRVTGDGVALLNSSLVSTSLAICGQRGGVFALAAQNTLPPEDVVSSPNLNRIGPGGNGDVWFSVIGSDLPEAPRFEVDRGELNLRSWPAADGSPQPATATIHASLSAGSLPIGIFSYGEISVNPKPATAPGDALVTASPGAYGQLVFFAPGARDGLVSVPVTALLSSLKFDVQPLDNGFLRMVATGPEAPPVSAMLRVSTSVISDIFGTVLSAPANFTVQLDAPTPGGTPQWCKVEPSSGTTPTVLRVTADPKGLSNGIYSTLIHLVGLGPEPAKLDIRVRLAVGSVVPSGQSLVSTPSDVYLWNTKEQPSDSVTVHISSVYGDPVPFTIGATQSWLSVTPTSGTTPADVKITATIDPLVSGVFNRSITLLRTSDQTAGGYIHVVATAVLPDYMGALSAWPMSSYPGPPYVVPNFAPGALFRIWPGDLKVARPDPIEAPPAALASSLRGFSFKLNGIGVPLRSYNSDGSFVAQIPAELAPGTYVLDEFDSSGKRIATTNITVDPVAPKYLASSPNGLAAWRQDGSVASPSNPVRPGEQIIVWLTGQGAVQPPVPSGFAAAPGVTAVPLSRVTATIGGKEARVSPSMSATDAGVLDVKLDVPNLADGEYHVSVRVGGLDTEPLPLKVSAGPLVPQIHIGGVVSAASYLPQIAPGSLFSIFGSGLADRITEAATVPLTTTLAGVSVTIGGKQAPLLFVSPGQINGQVPYEVAADPAAPVVVTVNGVPSSAGKMNVVANAPGIFEFGQNRAVVQNQDYSLNTRDNGAPAGSTAIAYLTGSGALDNPVATGSPAPLSPLSRALETVTATVNGVPATVSFAGLAPTLIGVMQVNFEVPDLPPGTYPMVFTMNGGMSNSAVITVR